MSCLYTREKNAQMLIFLLKESGIKKVVASPGNTNISFIGSIQNDPFFEIYSAVDERSAAYLACGLAEESGEIVVLSCTGATASRNYLPALTEAYYRKIPILAVTSTQPTSRVGHNIAQVIDRSVIQNDVVKLSVTLPVIKDDEDLWDCEIKLNQAILELTRNGGGPVHINLPTTFTLPFDVKKLPTFRKIERITKHSTLPELKGKVAVFIGSHKKWSIEETESLDKFCASNNAVVLCDHSSGYRGKYRILSSLIGFQAFLNKTDLKPDVLIHIGEITGDYSISNLIGGNIWRVNEDGEIKDTYRKLRYTFEMSEKEFFESYSKSVELESSYYTKFKDIQYKLSENIPEIPFSNIWTASILSNKLPMGCFIHFAILNSLRSWNFFELDSSISTTANVGGFGIDGPLSTVIGSSLVNSERTYFCVVGDLAFFYDMNALGNRHVGKNLRILLINNGKGTEFKNYDHHASYFSSTSDDFISAAQHFGNKSGDLVKNYVENLGLKYLSANNKEEFLNVSEEFTDSSKSDSSIVLEVFTNDVDESHALKLMHNIIVDKDLKLKKQAKNIIGTKGLKLVRKIRG
ncbi:thiamine pyrophosphate-binding protein [Vibrio pelagius]|uniref:thiamine pyrophosphate-binding protein n=1 Tax=Vibrio pelagius TaxID=28169 RepID=UPI0021C36797|nr:thiamine pyrophosphate-binding protein [Vibrio pelagius]